MGWDEPDLRAILPILTDPDFDKAQALKDMQLRDEDYDRLPYGRRLWNRHPATKALGRLDYDNVLRIKTPSTWTYHHNLPKQGEGEAYRRRSTGAPWGTPIPASPPTTTGSRSSTKMVMVTYGTTRTLTTPTKPMHCTATGATAHQCSHVAWGQER